MVAKQVMARVRPYKAELGHEFLFLPRIDGGIGLLSAKWVQTQVTTDLTLFRVINDEGFLGTLIRERMKEATQCKERVVNKTKLGASMRLQGETLIGNMIRELKQYEAHLTTSRMWIQENEEWVEQSCQRPMVREKPMEASDEHTLYVEKDFDEIVMATDGSTDSDNPKSNAFGVFVKLARGGYIGHGRGVDGCDDNNIVEAVGMEVALNYTRKIKKKIVLVVDTKVI
jgi:hypothetical protein